MIFNFHLLRSTLLMLVSAFTGQERILEVYQAPSRQVTGAIPSWNVMLIL